MNTSPRLLGLGHVPASAGGARRREPEADLEGELLSSYAAHTLTPSLSNSKNLNTFNLQPLRSWKLSCFTVLPLHLYRVSQPLVREAVSNVI